MVRPAQPEPVLSVFEGMKALLQHAGRFVVMGALMLACRSPVLAVALGIGFHLVGFALTHDLVHGALRLPRRVNEWLLAISGVLIGVSGHGMRLMHQRHHARPMAPDDIEGEGARRSFWGAMAVGPLNFAQYRVQALRSANHRERVWQIGETVVGLALAAVALGSHQVPLVAWVLSNLVMQVTAGVWASHLTHHPPKWLRAIAEHLMWTHSVLVQSFVLHLAHHAHPKLLLSQLEPPRV